MTSFTGLLLTGLVVFVVWTAFGLVRFRRPVVLPYSFSALLVPALLAAYTLREMGSWAHLPFPFSLLAWAVLIPVFLLTGAVLLARRNLTRGWPVLGVGVSGVLAVAVALLINHFTSGDPIL